jgi:glycosyltransferase involved in cell wall biosynthesis
MRILIVGMPNSIHLARWIAMLDGTGWDIHVIPVYRYFGTQLTNVTVHDPDGDTAPDESLGMHVARPLATPRWPFSWPNRNVRSMHIARVIRSIKPDIVHSHEFQLAGYQTYGAKRILERLGRSFPTWIASSWGSDIYLFARLPAHARRVRALLRDLDYLLCDCPRDIALAKEYGLRGEALGVIPVSGGFDLDQMQMFRAPGPTSARRTITLKGYQHWAGRAQTGLRAIERCGDALRGYRLAIYAASPDTVEPARALCHRMGLELEFTSYTTAPCPIESILRLHGRSRISIGLSISDGISASFLEAIAMGSYAIQSWPGCAHEWIEDGVTGSLVHPEDPDPIAEAIVRAVTNDDLVDEAAARNQETVRARLDFPKVRNDIINMYEYAYRQGPNPAASAV